jgi:hypothetical protein
MTAAAAIGTMTAANVHNEGARPETNCNALPISPAPMRVR